MLESVVENGKEGGKVTHTFDFCRDAVANSQFCYAQGFFFSELMFRVFQTFKSMILSRVSTNSAKEMIYP